MDKDMKTWTSDFFGKDEIRKASIYESYRGFEVRFYEHNDLVETRLLHEHNRQYAEDACENWVMGIIK